MLNTAEGMIIFRSSRKKLKEQQIIFRPSSHDQTHMYMYIDSD